ncbi:unnamed protein product [Pleuronectes platessa]|uniref:Uncharacterized protein n=1 Tax=Pleuronectes platessa TaxID=8262 RepID=A0A9N7Y889_PLEPL|nr:unnamed protein product [Pleuronectes platessa]
MAARSPANTSGDVRTQRSAAGCAAVRGSSSRLRSRASAAAELRHSSSDAHGNQQQSSPATTAAVETNPVAIATPSCDRRPEQTR